MTTNPTRPATGTPIATTWGLSVADTVIRRYPNAATRDTDLTGHTAADLLGQCVVLTDTGSLLQYAGPVMQWRKPWNLPWGLAAPVVMRSTSQDLTGGASGIHITLPSVSWIAGRMYRMMGEAPYVSASSGQYHTRMAGALTVHRAPFQAVSEGEHSFTVIDHYAAVTTSTADASLGGTNILFASNTGTARLILEDIGPAANPTALLEVDGQVAVDLDALEPEYRGNYVEVEG